jgi:hypothetical protein
MLRLVIAAKNVETNGKTSTNKKEKLEMKNPRFYLVVLIVICGLIGACVKTVVSLTDNSELPRQERIAHAGS